jgi:hypothetical protein
MLTLRDEGTVHFMTRQADKKPAKRKTTKGKAGKRKAPKRTIVGQVETPLDLTQRLLRYREEGGFPSDAEFVRRIGVDETALYDPGWPRHRLARQAPSVVVVTPVEVTDHFRATSDQRT